MPNKYVLAAICCLFLQGCIVAPKSTVVPHANYKIEVPNSNKKLAILEAIDITLISLGFSLNENDWEVWKPILDSDMLAEKKQERRYSKDDFEVFYGDMHQSEDIAYIRLHFYEHGRRQFSMEGIDFYYQLKSEFAKRGLVHLQETPDDINAYRPVVSPEQFNDRHPLPSLKEQGENVALIAFGFLVYALIIIIPGWILLIALTEKFPVTYSSKRCLFVFMSALVLFPAPIPMSIFGPVLLVPGVFMLPFVFGLPGQIMPFIGLSISVTLVLSLAIAFWLIKPRPDEALHRTSR